jgi:hypothetical protein
VDVTLANTLVSGGRRLIPLSGTGPFQTANGHTKASAVIRVKKEPSFHIPFAVLGRLICAH